MREPLRGLALHDGRNQPGILLREVLDNGFSDGCQRTHAPINNTPKKGRLVYVSGTLQTRKWRKNDEESDLTTTEILLVSNSTVQLFDK